MHNTPHSEESKKKTSESHKGIVNNSRRRKTIVKDGITLYQCGTCKEFKPYKDYCADTGYYLHNNRRGDRYGST